VDKEVYQKTTESLQADYTLVIPFLVKALLDRRAAYERRAAEIGEEKLFAEDARARGYLRPRSGYRLFEKRERLCEALLGDVRENAAWLRESVGYPLA
jgi:deoxyhypusine synthase